MKRKAVFLFPAASDPDLLPGDPLDAAEEEEDLLPEEVLDLSPEESLQPEEDVLPEDIFGPEESISSEENNSLEEEGTLEEEAPLGEASLEEEPPAVREDQRPAEDMEDAGEISGDTGDAALSAAEESGDLYLLVQESILVTNELLTVQTGLLVILLAMYVFRFVYHLISNIVTKF